MAFMESIGGKVCDKVNKCGQNLNVNDQSIAGI